MVVLMFTEIQFISRSPPITIEWCLINQYKYWVRKQKLASPTKNFVGFNLGFFNTKPLANRSTDDNTWKPIYQEACGRTLGAYKRSGVDNTDLWYSRITDREVLSNGNLDKNFGAMLFLSYGNSVDAIKTFKSDLSISPGYVYKNDTLIPGVYIKHHGTNLLSYADNIPDFVVAKWFSKVGRTAIGIGSDLSGDNNDFRMRIVVVQPGKNGAGIGVTVEEIRALAGGLGFDESVLLLDGSGSSQLAATKLPTAGAASTTAGRQDCLWATEIKTCSLRGDSVPSKFVSHLSPGYRSVPDPAISANILVYRPNPTQLIIEY